jgi:hypothetical protein
MSAVVRILVYYIVSKYIVGNNNINEYVDGQVSGDDLVSTATRSLTPHSSRFLKAREAATTSLKTWANFAVGSILTNDQQPVGTTALIVAKPSPTSEKGSRRSVPF